MWVTTPLGADVLHLHALHVEEGLSRPFEIRLDLSAAATADVAFDRLLGQGVTTAVELPNGAKRYFHGIVSRVAKGATDHAAGSVGRTAYRMQVVPKLWLLTRTTRSRIFQQKSVPDILRQVLTGLTVTYELQGTFQPRDHCVQYRESDFDFASRLMEEEGIYYFFTHADGQHTMVVANAPSSHPDLAGASPTLHFHTGGAGVRDEDRILEWEKVQELTSGKVTLWDHSFELPTNNLEATKVVQDTAAVGTVTHKLKVAGNDQLELYDYPGAYAQRFDGVDKGGADRASDVQKIFQDNTRTVGIRMQQEAARALTIRGVGDVRHLASGHKFTLGSHPDANGAYVVTTVQHTAYGTGTGGGTFRYDNRFTCIPLALPFRPARLTPRPQVRGCQTAVVVGPPGEEIFTDKYGRVKVQFHWDREGQKNADSSGWVRVGTPWAGKQWGAVHIPRVGQEVIVDFLEGDPDRPIIVGSVYNAEQMPPYTLPANKTQSGVKTRSSPDGTPDTFNEIRFEDKKGSEQLYIHAEKDQQNKVENDETHWVGHDRTITVVLNDTRTVGGKDKDGNDVGGDDTLTVKKGHRTVTLDEGNLKTQVKKGTLTTLVDEGDETHTVGKGKQTITVESDRVVHVKTGKLETNVDTGAYNTTVKSSNALLDIKAGKYEVKAAQEIVLKVGGATVTVKPSEIELKMGGTTLKLGPAGIEMKGPTVKVTGDGMVEVKGGMVKVEGSGMLQMKAPMSQLNGDGMLMAKGGLTMIN